MNLENIMLSEKDLHKVYATWLHLYEVLEEDKLNKDGKKSEQGWEGWLGRTSENFLGDANVLQHDELVQNRAIHLSKTKIHPMIDSWRVCNF